MGTSENKISFSLNTCQKINFTVKYDSFNNFGTSLFSIRSTMFEKSINDESNNDFLKYFRITKKKYSLIRFNQICESFYKKCSYILRTNIIIQTIWYVCMLNCIIWMNKFEHVFGTHTQKKKEKKRKMIVSHFSSSPFFIVDFCDNQI